MSSCSQTSEFQNKPPKPYCIDVRSSHGWPVVTELNIIIYYFSARRAQHIVRIIFYTTLTIIVITRLLRDIRKRVRQRLSSIKLLLLLLLLWWSRRRQAITNGSVFFRFQKTMTTNRPRCITIIYDVPLSIPGPTRRR